MIKTCELDVGRLQIQHLVQLAVKGTETNEIIEVKADYYWHFLTGETRLGPLWPGPRFSRGWIDSK